MQEWKDMCFQPETLPNRNSGLERRAVVDRTIPPNAFAASFFRIVLDDFRLLNVFMNAPLLQIAQKIAQC